MNASVTLSIIQGPLTGRSLTYTEPDTCLIGRDSDCNLILPDDADHRRISRHQCRLEVAPPQVRLLDLQSRNGTLVGERLVSARVSRPGETPGILDLRDGDDIRLGATVIRIQIVHGLSIPPTEEGFEPPAVCDGCWCDVPEEAKVAWSVGDGAYLCPACRGRNREATCPRCGKPLPPAPLRPGERLCTGCQADAGNLLQGVQLPSSLPSIPGYRIVRTLGQGGMGVVYLAQEETTSREVALKVMLPKLVLHRRARHLFEREMKSVRLLKHPNIVKLLDTGGVGDQLYYTMEYCDGGSVRDLIKTSGPLPVIQALTFTHQALNALEHAHNLRISPESDRSGQPGSGLIHRDLSPDNLFLAGSVEQRICKVGDYGLARAIDRSGLSSMTHTGAMGGKPAYVCRQQVRGYRFAQPEVDLWALTACLYTMLTGVPPRTFPPGRDAWTVVLEDMPVPIRQHRQDLPEGLAHLIDRVLDDSNELAFKTAVSLRAALAALPECS